LEREALNALLNRDLEKFLPDATEFIRLDSHMNQAKSAKQKPVDGYLREFVASVVSTYDGGSRTLDILNAMSECAKRFVKGRRDPWLDAAVVCLINKVGMWRCIDFCMYTQDL
jgi:hypothetical protein